MTRWPGITLTALFAGLFPSVARPQAVCSAPHSSPVLAGGGSIGTLPPGEGWVQLSVFRQRSSEVFGTGGSRQPFLAGGRLRTQSVYLTGGIGVVGGVDLWAQLPLHDVSYADDGGARQRAGVGDPRFAVRVAPQIAGITGIPLAVRGGVKLDGSRFPIDATIIPLGEGQVDWELSVETGGSFAPVPLYLLGWVGRRWRGLNREAAREPGDEWFGHLATGGPVGAYRWEVAVEYLRGDPPRHLGLEVPASRRRLLQLQPTAARQLGPGDLEVTVLLPISGRNLPAGPGFSLGYRVAWNQQPPPQPILGSAPSPPR